MQLEESSIAKMPYYITLDVRWRWTESVRWTEQEVSKQLRPSLGSRKDHGPRTTTNSKAPYLSIRRNRFRGSITQLRRRLTSSLRQEKLRDTHAAPPKIEKRLATRSSSWSSRIWPQKNVTYSWFSKTWQMQNVDGPFILWERTTGDKKKEVSSVLQER